MDNGLSQKSHVRFSSKSDKASIKIPLLRPQFIQYTSYMFLTNPDFFNSSIKKYAVLISIHNLDFK